MAETKTTIPVEIKMGNAGTNDANLPAFKEGSIIFTKDTKKIYIDPVGETERIAVGGTEVAVDSELSKTSTNPVQNKIINSALSNKQDKFADLDYVWSYSGNSVNQLSLVLKSASRTTSTGGVVISLIPTLSLTNETGQDVGLTGIAAPTADNDAVNKKYVDDNILDYISLSYAAGPSGNQETTSITADNSSTITLLNKDGIGIGISKGALAYIGPSNATLVGFNIDNSPIASEKYVSNSIATQVSSVYKAKGSIADISALPTPDKDHEGYVYNIESAFTTTANFVEGAGKVYPAGTNVVCINTTGTTYKWDVLAGMVDLSNYVTTNALTSGLAEKQAKFAEYTSTRPSEEAPASTSTNILVLNEGMEFYLRDRATNPLVEFRLDNAGVLQGTTNNLSLTTKNTFNLKSNIFTLSNDNDDIFQVVMDDSKKVVYYGLKGGDDNGSLYLTNTSRTAQQGATLQGNVSSDARTTALVVNESNTKLLSWKQGTTTNNAPLLGVSTPVEAADTSKGITANDLDYQAVNKKYVDDIKTELLNAITHPYTYDETTKELTLIL